MESRVERVVFETDRHRIVGDLTLPKEGYRSRLSDFLNRGDLDFIPLVNVELSPSTPTARSPSSGRSWPSRASPIQLATPRSRSSS